MSPTLIALAVLSCTHNGYAYACTNCARASYVAPTYHAAAPTYHAANVFAVETVFVATADHPVYASVTGVKERQVAQFNAGQQNARSLEDRVGAIEGFMQRIEAKLSSAAPAPAPVQPPPGLGATPAPPDPEPDIESPALAPGGFKAAPNDLKARTVVALRQNCASCHTGSTSRKKFAIFEDDGSLVALSPKAKLKIDIQVRSGAMPPPPAAMSIDDVAVLNAWVSKDSAAIKAFLEK